MKLKKRAIAFIAAVLMLTGSLCGCAIRTTDGARLSFSHDVLNEIKPDAALIADIIKANYLYKVSEKETVVTEIYCVNGTSLQDFCSYSQAEKLDARANVDYVCLDADGSTVLKEEGVEYAVGSERFTQGFDMAVLEMPLGSEREISVHFPEDHGDAILAGKSVVFTVKLNYVEKKVASSVLYNGGLSFDKSDPSYEFKDYNGVYNGDISETVEGGFVVNGGSFVVNGGSDGEAEGGSLDNYFTAVGGNGVIINGVNGSYVIGGGNSMTVSYGALTLRKVSGLTDRNFSSLERIYPADSSVTAEKGDRVSVKYSGTSEEIDSSKLSGEAEPVIGDGAHLPELENALIGAGVGETVNVEITFPEDYVDEFVGKSAVFELTVNWIGNTVAPEYNDANVKKYLGYDSVAIYEEKYGENVIGQLLLDHLLHSVELEADFTSELSDLEEYLEKKHTKYAESNGMTRERYAREVLSQLVKHQNSEIYARFIGGGTCSVKATATDGTVCEYGFMEMVDDAEVKGDVDLFSSCIRYIAVVHCVKKAVIEALVERYPELAMTDEEFDSAAREYLTGTLLMKDGEIAEYLDGYGREFTWCQLIGSAVIEKMKLKYVAEN